MPRNLTMIFDDTLYKNLETLQKKLAKGSKAEVVRAALMLLKHTTEVQETGGQIILKDKKGVEREVVLI